MPQRQQHYDPAVAAHAGAAPSMPSIQAPVLDDSGSRLARHVDDFMKTAGPLLGRAWMAQETARVDDAVLAAEKRMDEWQAAYQRSNQGSLAAEAAADYGKAWEEISREASENFDAGSHTVFPEMLRGRLAERGVRFAREGLQWQARQTELWRESQWQSQMDGFERMAAADPFSPEVDREAQALKDSWQLKHPGMDPGKIGSEIDARGMTARLAALEREGRVAEGRQILARGNGQARADTRGMDPEALAMIREAGSRHGFDSRGIEMLLAQAMQESGGRQNVVSHAGAIGVMQLMPGTARDLGVDPHDMRQNIEGGVRYIKGLLQKYGGSWEDALAAYNMGPGGYDQVRAGKRTMPAETAAYAPAIMKRLGRQGGGLAPEQLSHWHSRFDALERQQAAAARADLQGRIDMYIAASRDGHILDMPCSESEIRAAFGSGAGEVLAAMQGASRLAVDLDAATRLDMAGQNELLASRMPRPDSPWYRREAANHELLAGRIAAMQKQMREDPAGFALAHDESLRQAWGAFAREPGPQTARAYAVAMRAACEARGMESRLLAKGQAQALALDLGRDEDQAGSLARLAGAFGPDWPQLARELSPSLAPVMRLVAAGGMDGESARLILNAARDKDFEARSEQLLGIYGTDKTAFREIVHNRLADIQASFLAGGNSEMPQVLEQAVRDLALQHMGRRRLKQDEAISLAVAGVIGSRYEMLSQAGGRPPLRVPRGAGDAGEVAAGLDEYLANPPLAEIAAAATPALDPEMTGAMFASLVRREGYWVTDGEEGGAILFLKGRPVYGQDRLPVRKTWAELKGLGQAAREREALRESLLAGEVDPETM